MKLLAALFLALALTGCGTRIDVHWVSSLDDLQEKCGNDFLPEPNGCARGGVMTTPTTVCNIYILSPNGAPAFDDRARVYALGHEVLHCTTGRIHK